MKITFSKALFILAALSMLLFGGTCLAQLSQVVTASSMYAPPSPNASALLRYANVPVDEHTGVAAVVLPIDQLTGRQFSVPITLSYHGAGNKVQDIAGNVGLGFVLNAGGVITRVMRAVPDEAPGGYQYNGKRIYSGAIDSTYLNANINGKIDGEPDMFYFNFLGHTGKMVFDTLGNAQYLPDQGIRVIRHPIHNSPDSTNNAWVLKDFNGTTYIFGADTTSREVTVANLAGKPVTKAITYVSSWYLAKVISPDGKETITFNYNSGPPLQYEQFRNVITYVIHYDCTDKRKGLFSSKVIHSETRSVIDTAKTDEGTVITVLNPRYLANIQNDMGSVTFSYLPRQDLVGGQALNQIKVYNIDDSSSPLKTYTFNESYFLSPAPASPTAPDSKRLRLDCVSLQGRSAETKQLFVFTYNEQTLLPPRSSDEFDHWGYYTTLDNRGGFPSANLTLDEKTQNYDDGFDRRAPDSTRLQACILTKVRNINGGYTNFYYSMNAYKFDGGNYTGGGLRIREIVENDSLGQVVPITKQYVYTLDDGTSSGMVYNPKPYYVQGITNYQAGTVVKPIPSLLSYEISNLTKSPLTDISLAVSVALTILNVTSPAGLIIDVAITLLVPAVIDAYQFLFHRTHHYSYDSPPFAISSTPLNNLFDINGASVTYSQVSVINGDGGRTVNNYTSQQEYPDSASSAELNCLAQPVQAKFGNSGSYPPNTSFDFERGLLKQSKAYDNQNNLVSMVTNTYQLSKRVSVVKGQRPSVSSYATLSNGSFQVITYNIGIYGEISENIQLVQSTTQLFDQRNNGSALTTTHSYSWNPVYPTLVHSESMPRSDGKLLVNYVTYPTEYAAGTTFLDDMVHHNMLGVPIERISTLQDTAIVITGGAISHYKSGGLGLLDTVFSIGTANPITQANFKFSNQAKGVIGGSNSAYGRDKSYIAKSFYTSYDSKNNLVQSQNLGEPPSSTLWGYNQDVPIAHVSNAAINQVAYTSFETNEQQYWSFTTSGRDSSYFAKTGKVRYQLSSGAVTSTAALPAGTYILSLWTQGAKPAIGGTTADVSVVDGEDDTRSWKFYQDRVTVTAGSHITLTGSGLIDELRLYPLGAHISTLTVTPQVGTSSNTSADDKVNTYEYDALLRMKTLRDDQYNILKSTSYSNVAPVTCTSVPDNWIGLSPVCYTDQTHIVPDTTKYAAIATNSYGNAICSFTRAPSESSYLARVNFTVSFSDQTTYSSSIMLKTGDVTTLMGLPLTGKSVESISGIGIDTIINVSDDYGVTYQTYLSRQRAKDGYTETNNLTGGVGPYIAPLRSAVGCPVPLFSNHPQTGFSKNDCSNGSGSYVEYTVPAGTFNNISQFAADSAARASGQAYANAHGTCTAADTSWAGINPYCLTDTTDSATPNTGAYSIGLNPIPQVSLLNATLTRSPAEAAHDATVAYQMQFNDGSTATYTALIYKGQQTTNFSPPLAGYAPTSVTSVSVAGVTYDALKRLAYANRKRLINGVADGYQEANSPGTYYLAPLADAAACGTWYYNTPQTGFYKNDCAAGSPGAAISYTVPAHTDSSTVSQSYADALARSRGQTYANANGTCSISTGQSMVTTYAGSGTSGYVDGTFTSAQFNFPEALTIDATGNLYVGDQNGTMIRKITPAGLVSTLAGSIDTGYVDGAGSIARFGAIFSLTADASGNIFAVDITHSTIRKITPQGIVSTFAGGTRGYGDGQGTAAKFNLILSITIDQGGNLYVSESDSSNYRIRKITPGGMVSTFFGTGTPGNASGPIDNNDLYNVSMIAYDPFGNIYRGIWGLGTINGGFNTAFIQKISGGVTTNFAGNMNAPPADIDGTGPAASFTQIIGGLTTDRNGNIYLTEFAAGNRIRKVTPGGVVTTVAGNSANGYVNGTGSTALFHFPFGIVTDAAGNVYVADTENNVIRKITFPR